MPQLKHKHLPPSKKSRVLVVGRTTCLVCALRRVLSRRQLNRLHDELHAHGHVVYYVRAKTKHSKKGKR